MHRAGNGVGERILTATRRYFSAILTRQLSHIH
jgi:hypothetical protein